MSKGTVTTEKPKTVKLKLGKVFSEQGVPVPTELKAEKISKTDKKLVHVVTEHLFVGVLQHLNTAKLELQNLAEKKPDNTTVSDFLTKIETLIDVVKSDINFVAEHVEAQPNIDELTVVFTKLMEEIKAASLLQLTPKVPKEKMN